MHTVTMVIEIDDAIADVLHRCVGVKDNVWLTPDSARDDSTMYFKAKIKHFGRLPDLEETY